MQNERHISILRTGNRRKICSRVDASCPHSARKVPAGWRAPQGFAIVTCLVLMSLLVVISTGMLGLAGVSARTAATGAAQAEAQANARMALLIALGNLQEFAGADQRVTASADLLGEDNNRHWIGVWSTTLHDDPALPMVAGHGQGPGDVPRFVDLRSSDPSLADGAWREEQFRKWLVSGEDPQPAAAGSPDDSIELVGSGTVGGTAPPAERVRAPYVAIREDAGGTGGYAWWVGDESLKARIDLSSPHEDRTPDPARLEDGGMHLLAGAPLPGVRDLETPDGTKPYATLSSFDAAARDKLLSLSTVGLAVDQPAVVTGFHHVTTSSRGLLVDVTTGGLKKDLTAFLERPSGVPALSGIPDTGLAANTPMLPSDFYRRSGPSFAHLKNWYDLRSLVTGGYGDARVANPPFMAMRSQGISPSHFNMNSPVPDVTQASQPLQPVLTDARLAFDFSHDPDPGRADGRGIYFHMYPRVTLWNPYDVTLAGQTYFVGIALAQFNDLRIGGRHTQAVPGTNGQMLPGFSRMVHFTLAPIDIGPGEALVFSPDVVASGGQRLAMNSSEYLPAAINRNILSAAIPGGTNNFHVRTNRRLDDAVSLTPPPNYDFNHPTHGINNQSISSSPSMMLKRLRSAAGDVTLATLEGNSAETLQVVVGSPNGANNATYWHVFNPSMAPYNGGEGFQNYQNNPNRFPPRLWAVQMRMRWLDESDIGQSFNSGTFRGTAVGSRSFWHDNALIGNFNVRAPYTFRNPMGYYPGHSWTSCPGAYDIPWPTLRLSDPRMSIPFRNSKSQGSPFSGPGELPGPFAMFEVPRPGMPLFSLASFQHAQLGYHTWQPSYVVGHSIADGGADRMATVNPIYREELQDAWSSRMTMANNSGRWNGLIQDLQSEVLVHDIVFAVNQRLWDRYFLSTMPYDNGAVVWNPASGPLPNSNLRPAFGTLDAAGTSRLTGQNSFDHAAAFLANYGAFNVNSTSVEAWRAMLSSLNDIPRPTRSGGAIPDTFSRLLVPLSDQQPASRMAHGTWHGARTLTASEIDTLARTVVGVVRERGPFLSMADFVNRRLDQPMFPNMQVVVADEPMDTMSDPTLCGPLQAAIERSGINSALQIGSLELTHHPDSSPSGQVGRGWIPSDVAAYYPFKNYGAPGYVTQADVLQSIGPRLTVRGDTFVIRAYGDARDSSGRIIARAWCEAVVQRIPDYVAPQPLDSSGTTAGNNPLEPAAIRNSGDFNQSANPAMLDTNLRFGRRFVIESFRWLSPPEI